MSPGVVLPFTLLCVGLGFVTAALLGFVAPSWLRKRPDPALIAVMVVVFAVALSDKWLGLAAALTYAAGYSATLGLSLVTYYTGPKAGVAS